MSDTPYSDGGTSKDAADSKKGDVEGEQRRILVVVTARGDKGATCDEIETWLDMLHQTASARLNVMEKKGLVHRACQFRKTRTGRQAQVYLATSLLDDTDYERVVGRPKETAQ